MEHFQKREAAKKQEKLLSEEQKREVYRYLNQECFFEYEMATDTFWISREFALSGMNGTKISKFRNKLLRTGKIREEDVEGFFAFLTAGDQSEYEFRYVKEDGTSIWCQAKASLIRNEKGESKVLVGRITDIDQEKRLHEMLVEQAMLDPLTKLYSKTKAQSLIETFLQKEGSFTKHAFMIMDVQGFHEINENFGTVFGDDVLCNIADNLRKVFRSKDVVARIGGDDFLILMKDLASKEMVERKVKAVRDMMKTLYAGEEIEIVCNIGIACFPKDGENFGALFRNADAALYQASKMSRRGYELYDPNIQLDEYSKQGEFYHQYHIREKKSGSNVDFSKKITEYAVELMLDSKDVSSTVKLLLGKVGRYYDCDSVLVFEVDENRMMYNSYGWDREEGLQQSHISQSLSLDELPSMVSYFGQDGLRIFNNTDIMRKHPGYAPFMELLHSKSSLQCAFYEGKEWKGCVCLGYDKETHQWSKEEIEGLQTITKLLSVYLLKVKYSETIQEKIDYMNNYDELTKLPTQHKFQRDVEKKLEQNKKTTYAIVYMDINKFKYINDTLGYAAGDDLLKEIARTVSEKPYGIIHCGRVGSDNFLLLMEYKNQKQIQEQLQQLNEALLSKMTALGIGRNGYIVSGIATVNYGDDVIAAMDNANLARKKIKRRTDTEKSCCFYDKHLETVLRTEMEIRNSMQESLDNEDFKMYLQPKVDLQNRCIVGAEALTRWVRKDGTMMYPNQFIPIFERNGFIVQLDFYIYECVCKAIRKWMDADLTPVTVSVNVSRVHLNNSDFIDKVLDLTKRYNIPHEYLEFELTESIFLDNTDLAISTMKQLRERGFSVSIDDFGSGFSSLNLLKDMTTDVLKLDKEFFSKGVMKKEEKIIVSSITNMAKQLQIKVLSEGVETEDQSEFLKEISCDMAQGYLFAKPMPEEEFTKLLEEQSQR